MTLSGLRELAARFVYEELPTRVRYWIAYGESCAAGVDAEVLELYALLLAVRYETEERQRDKCANEAGAMARNFGGDASVEHFIRMVPLVSSERCTCDDPELHRELAAIEGHEPDPTKCYRIADFA